MIKQATVEDVSNRRVTRLHGRIIVVTRYYPRFLKKNLIHEYVPSLAPTKELLAAFKANEKALGDHDEGFEQLDYESRFTLSRAGIEALREISELARQGTVYLVCHCRLGQRCHRELLLIAAREIFDAPIGRLYLDYPKFRARLPVGIQTGPP